MDPLANSVALVEGAPATTGSPPVPHTAVWFADDLSGPPAADPVWGGPPDGPVAGDRPTRNGISLAYRDQYQQATFDDGAALSGWHGVVVPLGTDPHAQPGRLADYNPRAVPRSFPATPWDAGTELDPTTRF